MAKIVTITNPLTGQPAQVDQLDHTAQQIDDGLNIARGVSNPNLLDNWYFANCVDQRQGRVVVPNTTYYSDNTLTTSAGTTSAYVTAYRYATGTASGVNYASFKLENTDTAPTYYAAPENVVRGYTGTGYGIDRWVSNGASVLISIDGVTITGYNVGFRQILNDYKLLSGKTVTLSLLEKERNGSLIISLISGSFRQDFTQDGLFISQTITLPELTAPLECWVYHDGEGTSTLKAAKLELGTAQTLAHQDENGNWQLNEIPDYGEQLARCQRYFRRIRRSYLRLAHVASGVGRVSIPLDGMRNANPSIKFVVTPNVYAYNSWGPLAGASVSASATTADGSTNIVLEVTGSSALTTTDYVINNVCLDVINDL